MLWASGVRLTVEQNELAQQDESAFFVGNHQSALDIPILLVATGGRVRFMAKHTLFRIPIFGWSMWFFGHAPIDRRNARKAKESLDAMIERVRRKPVSLVVFPEGTRCLENRLLPFKQGATKIVQRVGYDVIPFAISGSVNVHKRKQFLLTPGPVRVVFGRPIEAEIAKNMSPIELTERLYAAVEDCFERARVGIPAPTETNQTTETMKA